MLGDKRWKKMIIRSEVTFEEKVKILRNLQDAINKIAISAEARGIDTSSWFYTDEEIASFRNDETYTFI